MIFKLLHRVVLPRDVAKQSIIYRINEIQNNRNIVRDVIKYSITLINRPMQYNRLLKNRFINNNWTSLA